MTVRHTTKAGAAHAWLEDGVAASVFDHANTMSSTRTTAVVLFVATPHANTCEALAHDWLLITGMQT